MKLFRVVSRSSFRFLLIGLCFSAFGQRRSDTPLIEVKKGDTVSVGFRYLEDNGEGNSKADRQSPWGKATVTRDDEQTTIDIQIADLPRREGGYFLYIVQPDNTATQIARITQSKANQSYQDRELGAFRLALATRSGLRSIEPGQRDVVMISLKP